MNSQRRPTRSVWIGNIRVGGDAPAQKSIVEPRRTGRERGEAIRHALAGLGHKGVDGVRQGKVIELDLTATDPATATAEVSLPPRPKVVSSPSILIP